MNAESTFTLLQLISLQMSIRKWNFQTEHLVTKITLARMTPLNITFRFYTYGPTQLVPSFQNTLWNILGFSQP